VPIVLVISRQFPPISSAGASIRLVKFIKYIASRNWKFVILTQAPDHSVVPENHLSAFLENELPPNTTVVRIPTPFSDSKTSNPAGQPSTRTLNNSTFSQSSISKLITLLRAKLSFLWGGGVFFHALRKVKSWNMDLIYAVAPTFTNAVIGALLQWFTGKPFILDLKDDWVGSPDFQKKTAWRRVIENKLEAVIIKTAAQVVLATEHSYNLYKKRYAASCDSKKFHFIPNGCDIAEYLPLRNRQDTLNTDKFLILSAAWGYQKDYRDITPFFLGLHRFFQNNPLARQQVEVVFLGNSLSREFDKLIAKLALRPIIKELGSVARIELVEWLWKANLFFLVQPVGNTTAISGTLYEYWAVGKAPILLIAEAGASSNLVTGHHLGQSFHFSDIESISDYIQEIYKSHQNKQPVEISFNGIEVFDRKTLAYQMADIWQKSIDNND
jgi:glycosyltransferase involved in cell wall biosynthesis